MARIHSVRSCSRAARRQSVYSWPASRYPTWNGSPGGIPPPPPPVPASLPATSLPTPPTPPALLPRLAVSTTWTLSTAILPRSLRRYGQREQQRNNISPRYRSGTKMGRGGGGEKKQGEKEKTRTKSEDVARGRKKHTDDPI